jgi:hypothetical protein|tara:strand:+ start:147 stop:992 length:846 start_codon:yes stop_codon:yes gene_type:complete
MILTKKALKSPKIFICKICNFECIHKRDYNRHLLTRKHEILTNTDKKSPKSPINFVCECGKEYKHRQSLHSHKRVCTYKKESDVLDVSNVSEDENNSTMEYLMKQNFEMKQIITDLCHKIDPISTCTNISNSNINSNNNIFNINVFLNETCKDAMNMTEFIESIKLTIEDVEKIGMEGQTQGLSNILSSKLNELDILKRPVHCSDIKNEIIYIKEEDKWEEEDKGKTNLKKALDKIEKESLYKVPEMSGNEDSYVKTISEIAKVPRDDKKILSEVSKEILV